MKLFRARVDFPDPSGALLVREASLKEIEMQAEWESWHALGLDRHSTIACANRRSTTETDRTLTWLSPTPAATRTCRGATWASTSATHEHRLSPLPNLTLHPTLSLLCEPLVNPSIDD